MSATPRQSAAGVASRVLLVGLLFGAVSSVPRSDRAFPIRRNFMRGYALDVDAEDCSMSFAWSGGTLRTGYPAYKYQVKTTAPAFRLWAAPGLSRVPAPPALASRLGAVTCPCGSGFRLPARGSSGAAMCHLSSSTQLLAQGSSGAITCPTDGFCRLQANK
jgi:hypothetical protein